MPDFVTVPVTLRVANTCVKELHRHSGPVVGHRWAIGCTGGENWPWLVGVAIAGRPVSRELDDRLTVEILRVCTDGTRNACSYLYAATVRIARAMGYRRWVTYTLDRESGASLRAIGAGEPQPVRAVYAERKWRWTIQLA